MDPKIGLAFSLIRKARVVVWQLTGAALLVRSGIKADNSQPGVHS
jgi:hypothetical protein